MSKFKTIVKWVILLLVLTLLFTLVAIPTVNDFTAVGVMRELCRLPLPEKTEWISSVACAGKLIGSGNGMQFFGAVLVKSELTLEELDAYYAQFRKNIWECVVEPQYGNKISDDIIEHTFLCFDATFDDSRYYIVYSWGSSDWILSDFDLRGH